MSEHTAENDTPRGLHPCHGCGLELDGDDDDYLCDECSDAIRVIPPGSSLAACDDT